VTNAPAFGSLAATDLIHGLRISLIISTALALVAVALSLTIRDDQI
jgi:hypothetical protein